MKRTLVLLPAVLLFAIPVFTQDTIPEPTQNTHVPYRIFRSQNVYTLLKLDTSTGEVWQVQWGADSAYRWIEPINLKPLAEGAKAGRFTL